MTHNEEIKVCRDCVHADTTQTFINGGLVMKTVYCTRTHEVDTVNGFKIYKFCEEERGHDGGCSGGGHFESAKHLIDMARAEREACRENKRVCLDETVKWWEFWK